MNLNMLMSWLVWGILGAESIVALALLISGLCFRARERGHARTARTVAECYASILDLDGMAGEPEQAMRSLRHLRSEVGEGDDCISGLMKYMLGNKISAGEIQALIDVEIGKADRGAIRLCGFLARTAPLAGLAGTLVGVQAALSAFSTNRTDPGLIIAGFSTALQTTLAGVLVAFMCMGASRLLIEPWLKRTAMVIFDLAMDLAPRIRAVKSLAARASVLGSPTPVSAPKSGCYRKSENLALQRDANETAPVESEVALVSQNSGSEPTDIDGAAGETNPDACHDKRGREMINHVSI